MKIINKKTLSAFFSLALLGLAVFYLQVFGLTVKSSFQDSPFLETGVFFLLLIFIFALGALFVQKKGSLGRKWQYGIILAVLFCWELTISLGALAMTGGFLDVAFTPAAFVAAVLVLLHFAVFKIYVFNAIKETALKESNLTQSEALNKAIENFGFLPIAVFLNAIFLFFILFASSPASASPFLTGALVSLFASFYGVFFLLPMAVDFFISDRG